MVRNQLIPTAEILWQQFVERHIALLVRALELLFEKKEEHALLEKDENSISEILSVFLKKAEKEFIEHRDMKFHWELPIFPRDLTELTGGNPKKPDFTAICPPIRPGRRDNYEIPLHVECKKLGKDRATSRKYVKEGILRFDCAAHQYGRGANHGIMVAYLVSGQLEEVQNDVNSYIAEHSPSHNYLKLIFHCNPIAKDEAQFERDHVQPNSFVLVHIWVQLDFNPASFFG